MGSAPQPCTRPVYRTGPTYLCVREDALGEEERDDGLQKPLALAALDRLAGTAADNARDVSAGTRTVNRVCHPIARVPEQGRRDGR